MEKDKNRVNKFVGISSNILGVFVVIILTIFCISGITVTAKFINQNWTDSNENIEIKLDSIIINLIGIIAFLGVILGLYKISKKISKKWIFGISIAIITIIGIFWVNYVKVPVKADQKVIYDLAFSFLDGKFNYLDEGYYLFLHPLQLGILYFIMFVYKIINIQSPLVFQNLNIIFVIISTIFLYKICKKIYNNEKTNRIFLILITFFIVMPMIPILVYGNIVGFMLSLISIYFIIKYFDERKIRQLVIASISMIFSIMLKQNSQVLLIAICIIMFLDFLKTMKKSNLIFIFVTVIITVLLTPMIYKLTETFTGEKVNDGIPMITYIAMGMAEEVDRAPRLV